ncbi:MAG: S-layer homology domain-containing protein [Clostridia bacterium]|nr:S-layer homology domain-containing protein [Clostridia bacterium]
MKYQKFLASALTAVLLAAPFGIPVSAYTAQRTYNGEFSDVAASAWYYDEVASAYSLGLINGKSATSFKPDDSLTLAETVKLAASCHQLISAGAASNIPSSTANWYDGYVDYAITNGIVTDDYPDYNAPATRGQVAVLFSRALISAKGNLDEINTAAFGDLPDISTDAWYSAAVYRLYRLGIMTGDNNRNIYPESPVKRSEISAVVMRMIDTNTRVNVGAKPASGTNTGDTTVGNVTTQTSTNKLSLYPGTKKAQTITGISGIGADFTVSNGSVTVDSACMLSLATNVELEKDCLSFRLYEGCGYESLSIARGWLDNAAVGVNGTAVNAIADKYDAINSLMYLYINEKRIPITQLWYADHTDANGAKYTTYAFYFSESIDFSSIYDIKFLAGMQDSVILEASGLKALSDLNKSTTVPIYQAPTSAAGTTSAYSKAVSDAKAGAVEILFNYECDRCTILYGRGLYGSGASDYRLVMIFSNGNTQTVYTGQLGNIRVNASGEILYYTVVGPDGKAIDYGVNFN